MATQVCQSLQRYDYVVVGGGPAGLTFAQCVAHAGKTVLVVDKNPQLGGCHRVDRMPLASAPNKGWAASKYQHGSGSTGSTGSHDSTSGSCPAQTPPLATGVFTEHGPRSYFTNYVTYKHVLKQAGVDFDALYAPVHMDLGQRMTSRLSTHAKARLVWTFLAYTFAGARGLETTAQESGRPKTAPSLAEPERDATTLPFQSGASYVLPGAWKAAATRSAMTSVQEYASSVGLGDADAAVLDQTCRYIDGAGAHRFTVQELFRTFDQFARSHQVQPRRPTDVQLFPLWRAALQATGRVTFVQGWEVTHILAHNGRVTGVQCEPTGGSSNQLTSTFHADRFVFAIPPKFMIKLLRTSAQAADSPQSSAALRDAFGPHAAFADWAYGTNYNDDVNVTFHWDEAFQLPDGGAFPVEGTPWGIGCIALSQAMDFSPHAYSRTVLSVGITKQHGPKSPVTGKSAADTSDPTEFVNEVYRQLRPFLRFEKDGRPLADVPRPTLMLVSESAKHEHLDHGKVAPHWEPADTAFVTSAGRGYLEPRSVTLPNFYSVGAQNGRHVIGPTTIEAAVSNAVAAARDLEGAPVASRYMILTPPLVSTIVAPVFVVLVVLFVLLIAALAAFLVRWARGREGTSRSSSSKPGTNARKSRARSAQK